MKKVASHGKDGVANTFWVDHCFEGAVN